MLSAKEIINKFMTVGIAAYETQYNFDSDVDIRLKSDDLDELVEIADKNGIKTAFYSYLVAEENDYMIVDDDKLDIDACNDIGLSYDRYSDLFENEQGAFNRRIDRSVFKQPFLVCVYILLGATQVGILQQDGSILNVPNKQDVLEEIINKLEEEHLKEHLAHKQYDEIIKKKAKEELIAYIDSTDEWHDCTNQRLRRKYCQTIIDRYTLENNLHNNVIYSSEIFDELELRWNKYKKLKSTN